MDTSKEYAKMCDCPEIQGERGEPEITDFCVVNVYAECDYPDGENAQSYRNNIWLPRQDQLQLMLSDIEYTITYHITPKPHWDVGFYHFAEDTAEQALLKLVMFELYKKEWAGNEWVLAKTI